jgi:hypothetical protein
LITIPSCCSRSHLLALLVTVALLNQGCARQNVQRVLARDAISSGSDPAPRILAVYEPWFGSPDHKNVGYSTHNPDVLRRQIDQARGMGIAGFVVDWYGQHQPFLDQGFALLQGIAVEKNFLVALMYDISDGDGEPTDTAIAALDFAYKQYIGPDAPNRSAYLRLDDRPVIFLFPKGNHVDWNRVRSSVNGWAKPPLLFFKDAPSPAFKDAFDGAYPWVHPGPKGWMPDGSDWGEEYLRKFYKTMKDEYPGKLLAGAAWPGFDDRQAHWGLNRYMSPRCGKTFDDTLHIFRQSYESSDPPPFLLIETWNDYEEGTAVERLNFTNCKNNP